MWGLPINPTQWKYISFSDGILLSFGTAIPANSIQIANVVTDLGVFTDSSFLPSI